jgi:hypothetical protein
VCSLPSIKCTLQCRTCVNEWRQRRGWRPTAGAGPPVAGHLRQSAGSQVYKHLCIFMSCHVDLALFHRWVPYNRQSTSADHQKEVGHWLGFPKTGSATSQHPTVSQPLSSQRCPYAPGDPNWTLYPIGPPGDVADTSSVISRKYFLICGMEDNALLLKLGKPVCHNYIFHSKFSTCYYEPFVIYIYIYIYFFFSLFL